MQLSAEQKKQYRTIGHELKPIVTIGGKGVSDAVLGEVSRALADHELIKVKITAGEREDRQTVSDYLCENTGCIEVQKIGKILLLLKQNPKANVKLSNLHRYKTL